MKNQSASNNEPKHFEENVPARSREGELREQLNADVAKLRRLLVKLNPLHAATHPFQKPSQFLDRLLRGWIIAAVILGLAGGPAFADLPPVDPAQTITPTVAVTENITTQTATVVPVLENQLSSADDFVTSGPLSLAVATEQNGRTLYVSASGSSSGDGSSQNPYASFQQAAAQLQAGDTLIIKAGTYKPTTGATFANSGTADNHIKVVAEDGVVIDGVNLYAYTAIFNTSGKNYLDFENLDVKNSRAAVQVTGDSSNILIDGLTTEKNQMAVIIDQGSYVTVRNGVFANSRNAVVANNTSHHLTFENIEAYGSQDIYSGYESQYRNGDGFIMNLGTHDVVFRNIITHDHWDAGIDTKAVNTLIDNVISYSNKNNFKVWADTTIINSMSYGARILTDDPVSGEGNGLNARTGNIKIINSTFFNNSNHDIQVDAQGPASKVTVQNSIFYRNINTGKMIDLVGGTFTESNNIFYWVGKSSSPEFTLNSSSKWSEPQFVNSNAGDLPLLNNTTTHTRDNMLVKPKIDLRLKSTSPAINAGLNSLSQGSFDLGGLARIANTTVDLGAYEYQTGSNPVDTTAPILSAVTMSNITAAGATVNWTTNEAADTQVQYREQGTTSWINSTLNASMVNNHVAILTGLAAATVYEYQVKSTDAAGNLATQAIYGNFTTSSIVTPPPTGSCITAMCGVTAGQEVSGTIKVQPNMVMNPDIRKVSYYLNGTLSGREYNAPFIWGTTGFDTTKLANGTYTLSGAYTTATGDKNFSIAFTVNNSSAPQPPTPTCATAICGVTVGQEVSGTVTVKPNLTMNPDVRKVAYYLNGTLHQRVYEAPFETSIDTTQLADGTYTLSGAYTTATGDKNFSITFTVKNGSVGKPSQPTVCITAICGVTNGQTVKGVINVKPNLELNPSIRKIAYYLNGVLYQRVYESPFAIALDTTQMANGTYTLSGAYTTAAGDINFSYTITVNN